ncbi:MAG: FAD-dependent monooxygenase [Burkholderiaceae bacterium]
MLESLRVWSALDHARVAPVYDMRIQAESPMAAVQAPPVHFSAYQGQVDALAWIVEGRNLDRTLARALDFSPVQRIAGSVVAMPASGAAGDGDARSLTLDNGASVKARLVIGADGAASIVRRLAGIDEHVHDYRHTAVVANFTCELPHQDCAYQWFEAPGVLALLPLPGDRCSLVWSAPAALAEELMTLSPRALALRVTEASDACFGALEAITPARAFALRRVDVSSLIAGRLALVGDAAHVVHPLAGQGMNLGFGDVAQWLSLLRDREPFRDAGDALLLRRYQRSRLEAILSMKAATDGLQRLFDPDELARLGPLASPLRHLRGAGWRIVAGSDWLRRRLIRAATIQ